MPKGLITSLLLKLTIDYWYFTVIALLIKFVLIRFTATDQTFKSFLIWITGNIAFYCMACIAGLIFSSVGFYYVPFIMFFIASLTELAFSSVLFRIEPKRLLITIVFGNGLFFLTPLLPNALGNLSAGPFGRICQFVRRTLWENLRM